MCGIFGEIVPILDLDARRRFTDSARQALHHRGPDGSGLWADERCVLGHARLAIIDLSDNASQPMSSASGRSHIVFNGEIYNYVEMRQAMEPPPRGFRSTSDTEVLLESIDRDDLGALERTLGMFAVALWRPAEGELLLIRDRFGKKPLYYAATPAGGLRFASEVEALLADGVVPRRTTRDRLAEYLQHGYVAMPRTGLVDLQVVPPGSILSVQFRDGGIVVGRPRRFWRLPASRPFAGDAGEWRSEFDRTLRDAVRIRLRSDVPLGAFLSGGVDSSVVSLLASEQLSTPLRTFTVDFDEARFSEGAYASEVARRLGASHTQLTLTREGMHDLPDVAATYGDLHGDSSALPTLAVCRAARQHVKVVLSGDGGDEVLGGYARYAGTLRDVERARRWPAMLRRGVRRLGERLPWWVRGASRLGRISADVGAYYTRELWSYAPQRWPAVLRPTADEAWRDVVAESLAENVARPPLLRLMSTDAATYLPEDVLVKVDRASMAFGLEVRSPLLDHRLLELTMQADPRWLADGAGATKLPMRDLYGARLPREVFSRPKMGFGVPLESWLRGGLEAMARDRLLGAGSPLEGLLVRPAVERLLGNHRRRLRDESARLWHLLVLDAWLRRWAPTVA